MFDCVLIANRGEIACRVIRSCKRLGIRSVAIYSDADQNALHVRMADSAWRVGPAAARDSYLNIDRVLQAAKGSKAQAIHPGYGFLSENPAFALACAEAGLSFIGPPVQAIRAMGSKSAAKALMQKAGVPLVPGYHGADQDPSRLRKEADSIGYPVLIKASAGGGGKGMRVVERGADFAAALASCQREASASFGDPQVLIEKYLATPRHIEIQIFADSQGSVASLHERDCSAQRRHQKVVEEAPAPAMSLASRVAMSEAAKDAARAVAYLGAGTVEFIVEPDGRFYFMEMNTRLQVEHPVTEMITGIDLVEWQLRVAFGEPLPLTQAEIPLRGHAIEVRVYAEEPETGFLPSIGTLVHFQPPALSDQVRVDSGVEQGDEIGPDYDPMIAKLIVHADDRASAQALMLQALGEFQVAGVGHNLAFLRRLIDHPAFRAGTVDTGLIERDAAVLVPADSPAPVEAARIAALWTLHQEAEAARRRGGDSPWAACDGWRLNAGLERQLQFATGPRVHAVVIAYAADGVLVDGEPARLQQAAPGEWVAHIAGQRLRARLALVAGTLHVFYAGQSHRLRRLDPLAETGAGAETGAAQGSKHGLKSPMPGKIIDLPVEVGARVDAGSTLVVMEAMKMEHRVSAPSRGRVKAYLCVLGDQVREGVELVDFEVLNDNPESEGA